MRAIDRLVPVRPGTLLLLTAAAVPLLALAGAGTRDRLSVGGFVPPGAESTLVARQLEQRFDTAAPNYVLVATTDRGFVTDAEHTRAGAALAAELAAVPGVADVISPWTFGALPPGVANPLLSPSGHSAALALRLAGNEDEQRAAAGALARLTGDRDLFILTPTGPAAVSQAAAETAESDLIRGELVAAPVTFLLLLWLFRGWRAAAIPLAVALVTILTTIVGLRLATTVTTVSVFALNLATFLGLGLSVDYSLLMVARFREERMAGHGVEEAARRTSATAGRTVVTSAATVILSLLALLVFPVAYLRSFALAGTLVVASAMVAALTLIPACLSRYGHRLGRERAPSGPDGGFWARQARRVMRRPVLWAVAVTALLLVTGAPFAALDAGRIDDRALPAGAPARVGADLLRRQFAFAEFHPVTVLTPWIDDGDRAAVEDFSRRLLALEGVVRVDSVSGFATAAGVVPPTDHNRRFVPADGSADGGTWFSVVVAHDPESHEAEAVVRAVRALDPRAGVGGTTATVLDAVAVVGQRLPWALAVVSATTLVLLFLLTGGVLLAVKGLALNLLSLASTFGMLVWLFQQGHLGRLLGVTATGRIDVFTPVLVFCIAFGLSMDYQVFLLARIREGWDRHGDNEAAVAEGLGHTGRTVTAAATLMALAVTALAASGVATAKMLGVGLTVAVLVDAFAVRATLVPALMGLAGPANWWAPAPLARLQRRFALHEGAPAAAPDPGPVTPEPDRAVPDWPPPTPMFRETEMRKTTTP